MFTPKKAAVWSVVALLGWATPSTWAQDPIVADHTVVAQYQKIPPAYLALVKKMWLNLPGESHSSAYRLGCNLLASQDSRFAVSSVDRTPPLGATDQNLRLNRATWGDLTRTSGWVVGYGEEDWFTSAEAIQRTKDHLTYCHTHGLPIAAFGFGWCWDMTSNSPGGEIDPEFKVRWAGASIGGPDGNLRWGLDAADSALTGNRVCLDTYLEATQHYSDYCRANGWPTKVFFTTGPVDGSGNTGENGYQRHLKHEAIRRYVRASGDRLLFDYADILCWSDAGQPGTQAWTDRGGTPRTYPFIHSDNMLDLDGAYAEDGDHIGQRGALRLAKAMWWMLARIAGWDGVSDTVRPPQIPVPPSDGATQLVNLSTRGIASTGENALIGGLVLAGPDSARKTLLIRGVGPTLGDYGLPRDQLLPKPRLTVRDQTQRVIASCRTQDLIVATGPGTTGLDPRIQTVSREVGAFALKDWGGRTTGDTALLLELGAGLYSVSLAPDDDTPPVGANATSGLVLLEIYDVSQTDGARLVNLSTRGRVETGDRQLIVGFVVAGHGHRRLLVRGLSPALRACGVSGCIDDTTVTVLDASGGALATNDDWGNAATTEQLTALSATLGAFALPANSRDAALLCRIPPGQYSARVQSGAPANAGICLAELYETP
ncbi:MAG: hypothetical protein HZA31_12615 [Opitutae bacterium]|nr:hypothetical protein [Opitutae bacterium]